MALFVFVDEEVAHGDEQFLHDRVFLFEGSETFPPDVFDFGDGLEGVFELGFSDLGLLEDEGALGFLVFGVLGLGFLFHL